MVLGKQNPISEPTSFSLAREDENAFPGFNSRIFSDCQQLLLREEEQTEAGNPIVIKSEQSTNSLFVLSMWLLECLEEYELQHD